MSYNGYLYPRCEFYNNDDPEIRRAVYVDIVSEYYKTKRAKKKAELYIKKMRSQPKADSQEGEERMRFLDESIHRLRKCKSLDAVQQSYERSCEKCCCSGYQIRCERCALSNVYDEIVANLEGKQIPSDSCMLNMTREG